MSQQTDFDLSAQERKRKRLEQWKQRQQQQQEQHETHSEQHHLPQNQPKLSLSLSLVSLAGTQKKKNAVKAQSTFSNPFNHDDDSSAIQSDEHDIFVSGRKSAIQLFQTDDLIQPQSKRSKSGRRWGTTPKSIDDGEGGNATSREGIDLLDQFMEKLEAGGDGIVNATSSQFVDNLGPITSSISVDVGGSMMTNIGSNVITAQDLEEMKNKQHHHRSQQPLYSPNDWLSDAATDDDHEEEARRALVEALKSTSAPALDLPAAKQIEPETESSLVVQTVAEFRSEKTRREELVKELEKQAADARLLAEAAAAPDLGRLYNDVETGVMEEAERSLAAIRGTPEDALTILAELNKKKELKPVDHSKLQPFQKNLYRVPRSLASLTNDAVLDRRAKLKVRVRGHGAPAPVSTFEECGLPEKILDILKKQDIERPYPIQAQCLPCIIAGRDVIGIAKTGSGKTLAYVLPMLRQILVQPDLAPNESGPVGLVLAPARELALQIHLVCKGFTKQLGLKSTAVYGGAGVAEQIGDLKRGTHVVVATPGRLIDLLTMQSGKILSLHRVTYVVMDEADRMYDMGFAPQISAVLDAIRPDRQTVLFSATFPKTIEALARKSLKYPLEVVVGGRSVASDSVTQYAEVVEESDKFLRLLQLLGEQVDGTKKAIVFVDTQVRADSLFEQLLRNGYPALSLHGGMEQEDRDSTIYDFKRKDGPNVLVATGVAGRGLDVPSCACVINYSAPNHLEAYVHQTGRTGRAGNKGTAFTFVNSADEAKFAPIIVRALSEAGQSENISPKLRELSDEFKSKVEKGEAKYAGSGFKGKGYTYDSSEMTEAQKMARMEKRQVLIEAGLLDPDEEDPLLAEPAAASATTDSSRDEQKSKKERLDTSIEIPENLTPELLALPGMKEALLRKAGIVPGDSAVATKEDEASKASMGKPVQLGDNHWLQEVDINDYPREARWKVTQKETTSRLQDEFRTAVTLKGSHFAPGRAPGPNERRLYLHLEAASDRALSDCVMEIQRILNEETLRAAMKGSTTSHKYNVLA